jgi:uncharacterized protein YraI
MLAWLWVALVLASSLATATAVEAQTSVTATPRQPLNMRAGPGTTYKVLGRAAAGVALPVLGKSRNGRWLLVDNGGQQGWIAKYYCKISGDLAAVPVSTQTFTPSSSPPSPSSPPPAPSTSNKNFELGGQVPGGLYNVDVMRSADMTWAKSQVVWTPGMNPSSVDGIVNDAHGNGFKILLSITGPSYPSGGIDYAGYVNFVAGVAARGADGIEIWNEMNLDREWPAGQIDPGAYVNNMLKPAYQAIKASNPNTLVVSGALAPTGAHNGTTVWSDDIYIAGMRDAGAAKYFDCAGVHANALATSPDVTSGHPADAGDHHYSWYYKGTYNLYASTFSGSKLCFTELGVLSPEGYGPLPGGFWWAYDNTVAEQAAWLARAVTLARGTGRVRLMIIFNVGFTQYSDDPQAGYSIIRPGGGCPACASLNAAMP